MEERLAILEEFVRAYLWAENFISNNGMTATDRDDYNERVIRVRNAIKNLPKDLFDETLEEDSIIYKDVPYA